MPPCPASPPSLNNHSPYRPSHRKFHHSHSIRYLMPLRLPPTPHTRKDSSTLLVEFKYANCPPTLFCLRTPHRTTNSPPSPPQHASPSFYSLVSLAETGAPNPLVEFKFRIQTRRSPSPTSLYYTTLCECCSILDYTSIVLYYTVTNITILHCTIRYNTMIYYIIR